MNEITPNLRLGINRLDVKGKGVGRENGKEEEYKTDPGKTKRDTEEEGGNGVVGRYQSLDRPAAQAKNGIWHE